MKLDCGRCVVRDWTRADQWLGFLEAMDEPTHWAIEVDGQAVGEPYWGRGIMSAAVGQVAPYALQHFRLAQLQSPVFEWNAASMRVLEKCGFVRERVLRESVVKDGRLIDQVLYLLSS